MGRALIVKNDPVDGTDTHQVTGPTTSSPPVVATWTGDYRYQGAVAGGLSDFVTVNGIPLAVVTSTGSLRVEGAVAHQALSGGNFVPPAPVPNVAMLTFTPAVGVGDAKPAASAGSALLTAGGAKALLDGDPFDTCGIPGGRGRGKVAARGQSHVTCSV